MKYSILTVFILALTFPCLAQDSLNVTKVGEVHGYWQSGKSVALSGDYAYIVSSSGMRILDIGNPGSPNEIGFYDILGGTSFTDIAICGNLALVTESGSLQIIDVSDPVWPCLISQLDVPYLINPKILTTDSIAYMMTTSFGFDSSLIIVDFSDPVAPTAVGSLDFQGSLLTSPKNLDVCDSTLVIAGYFSNLVIDVSDPTNPTIVAEIDNFYSQNVVFESQFAFFCGSDENLHIYDLTNPAVPTQLSTLYIGDILNSSLELGGRYLYITESADTSLHIIDVRNPADPVLINSMTCEIPAVKSIVIQDGMMILMNGQELAFYDLTDPIVPESVGYYNNDAYIWHVFVEENYAYILDLTCILRIFDLSNPANPQEVGYLNLGGFCYDIVVLNQYAYIACASTFDGIRIVDVSDPGNPQLAASYVGQGESIYLQLVDNLLYSCGTDWFQILDISNPVDPLELSVMGGFDIIWAFQVDEGFVYITEINSTLFKMIDVNDPITPFEAGSIDIGYNDIQEIQILDNCAYLAGNVSDTEQSLILDVSDPEEISIIDSIDISHPKSVEIFDHFVLFGGDYESIIFDVANPQQVIQTGLYQDYVKISDTDLYDGKIVAAGIDYLSIYDPSAALPIKSSPQTNPLPKEFSLTAYPNPFNPTTTLTFTLLHASRVTLDVYDIIGRNVTSHQPLVTSRYEAGTHTVTFNGENLASGIYFVKMEAGNYQTIGKIVQLK